MDEAFWSVPVAELSKSVNGSVEGLTEAEAARRRKEAGDSRLRDRGSVRMFRLLVGQFSSPLVLMLLVAAGISLAVGSLEDALIILGIVLLSGVLGFYQEHQATRAVERLLKTVQVRPSVRRDGKVVQVPTDEVVVGDILVLSAGALVAADARILSSRDLHVDEAALTGESFPVEKQEGEVRADAPPSERRSALFMGTHVVSGTAEALVVATGKNSAFGNIAQHLADRRRPTDFERGVQHFGYLLVRITVVLVLVIFALHMFVHRPVLESFLFALALAVGLVPELLPVIVSITLAQGARRMAEAKVIVKRLAAIENFGSMDILCSDKTGTLTEGRARVREAVDVQGMPSARTLQLAAWNAALELGLSNPIDDAIRERLPVDPATVHKLDELPYDFLRRRMSVLADVGGERLLITKGAVNSLLPICSGVELADGRIAPMEEQRAALLATFECLSAEGLRTLAVAGRALPGRERVGKEDERELVFSGFLVLEDPPRADSAETVAQLNKLGIRLKIITGDNPAVGAAVAARVGLTDPVVLTGVELRQLSPEALVQRAGRVDVFAEVEPMQKEGIILALRSGGHVVGYVGDGINDAPALQAADVGISVQSAVDVAREAADLVMLEPNLRVLVEAVQQGRRTFENTLKYVYITTSANFGNMLSMAVAAVFLPFLPLLPKQILLNNFLSDFPAMTIGNDRVEPEMLVRPRRWDVQVIRNSMVVLGAISSFFDLLTFAVLILLQASPEAFRTGWFMESLFTELLILLVVRTRRPLLKSRPSPLMIGVTVAVVVFTFVAIYTPVGQPFGLVPLPPGLLLPLLAISVGYMLASELAKRRVFAAMD